MTNHAVCAVAGTSPMIQFDFSCRGNKDCSCLSNGVVNKRVRRVQAKGHTKNNILYKALGRTTQGFIQTQPVETV